MYPFCIYGAGIVAVSIYTALKSIYSCMPVAFLISEKGGNPSEIDGIPVKIFKEWSTSDQEMMYLIAVPESHHAGIAELLSQNKISREQIIFVGNKLENKIMGDFYFRLPPFVTVQQLLDTKKPVIEVFQAKSHVDHTLQNVVIVFRPVPRERNSPVRSGSPMVADRPMRRGLTPARRLRRSIRHRVCPPRSPRRRE